MRILIILALGFVLTSCNNREVLTDQNNTATPTNPKGDPNAPKPEITFEEEEITLSPIDEGDEVTILYNFSNTGKAPLIITGAKGSCGCTATEYSPKEPIQPGDKGMIRAVFNSSGKPKNNTKTVTISSNDPAGETVLKFNVYVNPKSQYPTGQE